MTKKPFWMSLVALMLVAVTAWGATYTGTTIVDLSTSTPDGATEPVSVLDDAVREIKTVMTGTKYQWTKLTNKTGAALAVGDVVAIDTGNNSAVALGDTSASIQQYVIALQTIADAADGLFAVNGVVASVKSTGAIARGQYVKKSSTTLVVDDAGTAVSATNVPPVGSIGVALTAASGNTLTVYFWGRPYHGINATTCTNQFVRSFTTAGVGTCAAVANADLAGSIAASKLVGTDIATVGTITSGTWTGTAVGLAYGGTGLTSAADDTVIVSTGSAWQAKTIPNCVTSTSALQYTQSSNTFSCGTITSTTIVRKTADEIVNNSVTLQNDDELLYALAANDIVYFRANLIAKGGTGGDTADFKLAFTVPTAATLVWSFSTGINFETSATTAAAPGVRTTSGDSLTTFIDALSARLVTVEGIVVNGANAGNLQLQWAQNVAHASDTQVLTNSYLMVWK